MDLLLIRHAQTEGNVVRALDTAHPGADLTDLGEQQVRELATALAAEQIDAVHVSPRLRTRRTAAALLAMRALVPVVDDGLVEIDAGDLEMSTTPADAELYNQVVSAWVHGDLDARVPGGEDGHEAMGRFDAAVERIAAAGHERVAVVSHGAVLRSWCGVRVEGAGSLAVEHPLRNTGLVRVSGEPGRWRVTAWDEQVVEDGGEDGPTGDPGS